jgi:hypothetical protein
MENISKQLAEYLLTNGVLGFTTMLFALVAAYLYRARELDRRQWAAELEELHKAHAEALAAERTRNLELQEKRVSELRSVIDASAKFTATLDSVLAVLGRSGARHG